MRPNTAAKPLTNITTRGGDKGLTGLFSGERVSKGSQVMETLSKFDALDSAIGVLRNTQGLRTTLEAELRSIQLRLIHFKGELAIHPSKWAALPDYLKPIALEDVTILDQSADAINKELERQGYQLNGWTIYGDEGPLTAYADNVRAACREAEVSLDIRQLQLSTNLTHREKASLIRFKADLRRHNTHEELVQAELQRLSNL
jgi:cob(I)alamin adenosyltransferase